MNSAPPSIEFRLFIVGYPRSGTTLLQKMLAMHPRIQSLPETHFFPNVVSPSRSRRHLLIAGSQALPTLERILQDVQALCPITYRLKPHLFVQPYVQDFVHILDHLTRLNRKTIWLEKTPRHLHYIELITRYVPQTRFIHLLRNGADAIASLYDVTHRYPDAWGGPRSLERCVDRWLHDRNLSLNWSQNSDHLLITYNDLTVHPVSTMRAVCSFIGIPFEHCMLNHYHANKLVVLADEPWKETDSRQVVGRNAIKFYEVLNLQQQAYVKHRLQAAME